MFSLQHGFGARLAAPPVWRAARRTLARLVLGFRRRPARLREDRMPAWQLRDLGFRDGRTAPPREDRPGRG